MTIARHSPCPCGSGKKYKRCCAAPAVQDRPSGVLGQDPWWVPWLLVLIGVAAYLTSFQGAFVLDDRESILENMRLRRPSESDE